MTFYWGMNIKTHGMDIKLTKTYKLISFNVVVDMTYKRFPTVIIKLTNLMLLKNR
ncbi:hypothetical protein ABH948_001498 [Bacillus sp. RC218]